MADLASSSPDSFVRYATRKFIANRTALSAAIFIVLSIFVAVFANLLAPDKTPNANSQQLELSIQPPGFTVDLLCIPHQNQLSWPTIKQWFTGIPSTCDYLPVDSVCFSADKLIAWTFAPAGINDTLSTVFLLADLVFPGHNDSLYRVKNETAYISLNGLTQQVSIDSMRTYVTSNLIETRTYWLGTDRFGRDMLSRLLSGTRISLSVGFISVFISLLIGLALGCISGYYRGWTDKIIMWLINVTWSIPTLLMVIAITLVLGKGFWQVFVAVGLSMWVEVARIARGEVLSLREKDFVAAATILGYSSRRIIIRHILPNIAGPVIIISASNFATAILLEAGLSFLGIGVQPPLASWGGMIKDHYGYIMFDAAYLAILPGLAIMFMVLSFNMIGNGLRDAFDTREKQ